MNARSKHPEPSQARLLLNGDLLRIFMAASRLQSLSAPLFTRVKDGMRLTEEGHALLQCIANTERHTNQMPHPLNDADVRLEGNVTLTAPSSLALSLIVPNLSRLYSKYPSISLDLVLSSSKLNLSERDTDIAVRIGLSLDQSLIGRQLGNIKFFLYASETYLEQFGHPNTLEDLQQHRFVDLSEGFETSCRRQVLANIVPVARRIVKTDCTHTQLQAISDGIGIGMLTDYQVNYRVSKGPKLIRLLPEHISAKEQVWIHYRPGLKAVATAGAVTDFIIDSTKADFVD